MSKVNGNECESHAARRRCRTNANIMHGQEQCKESELTICAKKHQTRPRTSRQSHRRNVFWRGRFIRWLIIIINLHEIIYTKCAHLFSSHSALFVFRCSMQFGVGAGERVPFWVMVKERAIAESEMESGQNGNGICDIHSERIFFCTIVNIRTHYGGRWHINENKDCDE